MGKNLLTLASQRISVLYHMITQAQHKEEVKKGAGNINSTCTNGKARATIDTDED